MFIKTWCHSIFFKQIKKCFENSIKSCTFAANMAREYVNIKPEMLTWAITRAGHDVDAYLEKNPQVKTWIDGEKKPTVKQLEVFAEGYAFLVHVRNAINSNQLLYRDAYALTGYSGNSFNKLINEHL